MIGSGIVLAAHVALAATCAAPLHLTLNERDTVQVALVFACTGTRGTMTLRRADSSEMIRSHAFTRASVRVDRDGSKRLRLIDRHERASDLVYRDGAVELWRGGQRLWRRALAAPAVNTSGS